MSDWLPKRIDAYKLGRKKTALAGAIDLDSLRELKTMVSMPESGPGDPDAYQTQINVRISFDCAQGAVLIQGQVAADLVMLCQRCLKPMPLHLDSTLSYAVRAQGEEDATLVCGTQEYEVLRQTDEEVDLYALIEEELILSLPLVARHRLSECPAGRYITGTQPESAGSGTAEAGPDETGAEESRVRPFADLKDWLGAGKTKKH